VALLRKLEANFGAKVT